METFLFLLELAGTVAFAVSGAVLGIEKHMDIFGVGLLGITTAVGGGILRDLVVGLTPPRAFQDPIYLLVALGVSVVLFFPFVRRIIGRSKRVFDALMLIMDAAGLGIFTITGMNTATTLMITTAMPAVITPRTSEERMRFESRSTTSRLAASNSERS